MAHPVKALPQTWPCSLVSLFVHHIRGSGPAHPISSSVETGSFDCHIPKARPDTPLARTLPHPANKPPTTAVDLPSRKLEDACTGTLAESTLWDGNRQLVARCVPPAYRELPSSAKTSLTVIQVRRAMATLRWSVARARQLPCAGTRPADGGSCWCPAFRPRSLADTTSCNEISKTNMLGASFQNQIRCDEIRRPARSKISM